ncbi:DUF1028 domain-containing protein [Maritimibacter dapengensis]|uniref:DUF1028 domain-containing protein n=1 Tax=Maritimibacter dapengensis TaxID=2836868 RepID=A0ABS6SYM6_9RHOB|nr:DUF1028 domain-containing protein [Maritimibacter dapengensis]MBV7378079.1 DUF1028 domain-containing protein [Maritimibacter dapengensis]
MTFSILVRDPETGDMGGAAATGSLCVGGWVLRGRWGAGLSASQGASPSTLWGEKALREMEAGATAYDAVNEITAADAGREFRQLAALDMDGFGGTFSGDMNTPEVGDMVFPSGVASGNLLASPAVIPALVESFDAGTGTLAERLIASLFAGQASGSDSRGLVSAALLVISADRAPLSLRIDHSDDPLTDLADLHERATTGEYAFWARQVPTVNDPDRGLD